MTPVDDLVVRLQSGDIGALARAISLVDSGSGMGTAVYHKIFPTTGNATVIGITGPPGVGKSTLISAIVTHLRGEDKRVAVVAVDPSSPITGGALLGDRTRMGAHSSDPGVFIRSLSTRGHLGGLSANIFKVIDLIDAAGWETIIIETVGAGQSETEIVEVADINVVVNAPGLGDDVQAIKAGILEIADIFVVNKADSPLVQRTERQLQAMLQLRKKAQRQVPIVKTIATTGTGIDTLVAALAVKSKETISGNRKERLLIRTRRRLAQEAATKVKKLVLNDQHPHSGALFEAVIAGECDSTQAINQLLSHYFS